MKKILAAVLLLMVFASPAFATQHHHHHHPATTHHHHASPSSPRIKRNPLGCGLCRMTLGRFYATGEHGKVEP
jgi:hypothetical protein